MIGKLAAKLFRNTLENESTKLSDISRSIFQQPVKMIAAFFTAPFLLYKIIQRSDNPRRRTMAKIGLVVGIIGSYLAGTFLGTAAATLLIIAKIGFFTGLAFWIGTSLSVFFTVLFQLFTFNMITYAFLHMNPDEVMEYLHEISS